MPVNPVFRIRNLHCAYEADKVVLHIPELDIPRGELVFVLGISGIGKSTLIETLGMMNHTIVPDPDTRLWFQATGNGTETDLGELWKAGNEQIARFRSTYFSFIFQNNNLMPNFTAGENMAIGLMINRASLKDARPRIESLMEALDLPLDKFDTKVTELSGGQRQRLSFVRAITSSFEVLFGDEPTGNLDRNTAKKLLHQLKAILVEENKTGLIVSHDVELALQFADRILVMTARYDPDRPDGYLGEILAENILRRKQDNWIAGNDKPLNDPDTFLQNKTQAISKN